MTVGNIGSDRKMDYTVIGDMVNLASRLEGLTKMYGQPIVVSQSVQRGVPKNVRCRLLDRVKVKGKGQGWGIYAPGHEPDATSRMPPGTSTRTARASTTAGLLPRRRSGSARCSGCCPAT